MDKRPAFIHWACYAYFILLIACNRDPSAKVLEKHLAQFPGIEKKYIYQSILRLANIKHDPDFDKLIKDVNKIILYFPPGDDSTYQVKNLRTTVREGGYEELIDVRTAQKDRISLWVNDSLPEPHYMGILDTSQGDYIFEIDGQINMDYLSSINVVDQNSLRNLLN
ncbi:MAG TPA: hypothetical protein VMZ69_07450 [Saprospiraceae bacterium]|nr:hypothetical protein [Saprospiraceae bacterium]